MSDAAQVRLAQPVVTLIRLGKWELRVQLPANTPIPSAPNVMNVGESLITGVRSQGSNKWLKPSDGLKWRNASSQVGSMLGPSPLTFITGV